MRTALAVPRPLRQAARRRPGDRLRAAGLRRRRRRHQADPADRSHDAVPVLRRLVAGRQLGARSRCCCGSATPRAGPAPSARRRSTRPRPRWCGRERTAAPRAAIGSAAVPRAAGANANYIQVVQADELDDRAGNTPLDHRRVRPAARPDPRRSTQAVAAVDTDERPAASTCGTYADGPLYAPVTGYYSIVYGATGIERDENDVLTGTDDRLFVDRIIDLITGRSARAATSRSRSTPAAQQAAYDGLHGQQRRGRRHRPATGAILAMASHARPTTRTCCRRTTRRKDRDSVRTSCNADPRQAAAQPGARRDVPAGLDVQGRHRGRGAGERASTRRTPRSRRRRRSTCRTRTADLAELRRHEPAAGGKVDPRARRCRSPATPPSPTSASTSATTRSASRPRSSASTRASSVPLRAATSRSSPADLDAPQTAQAAIGQFDVRATPLQMAMVGAGVANDGVVMKPYLVDQVLAPDLSVRRRDRARGVQPRRSRPEVAAAAAPT